MSNKAKTESVKKYTIEQFIGSESIELNSISFDEKYVLYSSDKTGVFNAYQVTIEDGVQTQLTYSKDNGVFALSFFPKDNRILYTSDKGGNEILHLYVRNEDGTTVDLTPGAEERAEFYSWSKDGKSFFYGSNKRNPSFMDVYEMDCETFDSTCLFTNNDGYEFGSISPDKRYIALDKIRNANDSNMYLFDRQTEALKHISKHEGDIQFMSRLFSNDSKDLYFLTDELDEFLHLKSYKISSGVVKEVIRENWDISFARLSENGTYLIYGVNNDGSTDAKILELSTNKYLELLGLPKGQMGNVKMSKSEKLVTFLFNSSDSPNNLFSYQLETKDLKRLTNSLNPEIDAADLIEAEVIRYQSFDGLEIPAIFYPPVRRTEEKAPGLVFVHGGPGGQSRTDFNPLFQYLANHGYAVLAVNNRGSSGYGKTFFSAADLKHGEIDLEDCIQGKTFLQSLDYIDSEKIGIIGGSYGGYMVLAALAFRPEEFKVGVDIFGVANWERTLKSIPAWWEGHRDALYKKLGNPYTQTEYIRSISPLFHADNITKPLIVLQGANDPRVLKVESDEIVAALEKNNVPVEYIVFPDEGHGFMKKENRIKGYGAILEFLNQYLN
ncbi:S9 family peptidase [Pseudoneobacillus sp. C159]